ncbi:HAMP domain-containing sensor histidine kinase [uncultured Gemmiger sp.]|uniref:HAMP domain-containing sensor histidine kinase n=1 Tax=uncultured Gemmiger sp. TaxID=1623490 RepID=UPI0025FB6E3F|nr:HAMP domain-containing sensor histidine kinase [uncultured Gemmiger sp.]
MTRPKGERLRQWLRALRNYLIFFLTMCFVITCCMLLFLNTLSRTMGLELARPDVEAAAKITFLNVVLLSLACTLIDWLRRRWMVDRPVKIILNAAQQIMAGDFSVRVPPFGAMEAGDGFGEIAACMNRMAQELSGTETLRNDFIANVSHELKTPLAVMQNYGTLLQQPALPEQTRVEYARAVTDAARRLADMVSNILKLNKLENQTVYPDTQTYDLGEQLCECLLTFEDAWEKKNLDIRTDLAEEVKVTADPELLRLVWNNLFSNAVKFTEPGGSVSLSLQTEGEWAVVQVTDTGCGIPKEVGAHIFEKFYQGDTSHAAQGNGLGLALVRRVIDIVGGEISVTSQVGRGSTFTVKIRKGEAG